MIAFGYNSHGIKVLNNYIYDYLKPLIWLEAITTRKKLCSNTDQSDQAEH